jgi:hypothetical protein
MPYALCPMPYALCPMPSRTSYESSKGYIFPVNAAYDGRQRYYPNGARSIDRRSAALGFIKKMGLKPRHKLDGFMLEYSDTQRISRLKTR